ncbi:ATP-binding protein [Streptomyces californicus]
MTELATNALRHGVPPGRGFKVHIHLDAAWHRHHPPRSPRQRRGRGVPGGRFRRRPEDEGGRGLLLVAAVADAWGVKERNPGKIVWCEFSVVRN